MQSNFDFAFHKTMLLEDSHLSGKITFDNGGKTRFGVAQHSHPEETLIYELPVDEALERAKEFYSKDYWTPVRASEIVNSMIAWKLCDIAYNCGVARAIKVLQYALKTYGKCDIVMDAKIGPATLAAVNSCDGNIILDGMREIQEQFYKHLVEIHPEKFGVDEAGWKMRAQA